MNDKEIHKRLARMESRIVQIMLALDLDPYERMYDNLSDTKHSTTSGVNPQGKSSLQRYKAARVKRDDRLSSLSSCSPF